jgi:multiple sugar transport system permease protein
MLTAIPAAWALSRLRFRGRKVLTGLYILVMLMPFQVTMTPNFLVLDALGLMDTVWAVILPGIFSAFPVFIMLRFFDGIPRELLDSADLDGADHWETFWYIGLPLGRPGILAAMVLTFLESWSAVDQPLTFLREERWLPLSLRIGQMELSQAMGAGLVALIPAVLVFRWGQKYLELGIRSGTMEEV